MSTIIGNVTIQTQKKPVNITDYYCYVIAKCNYYSYSKIGKFNIPSEDVYDFIVNNPISNQFALVDVITPYFKMFWDINLKKIERDITTKVAIRKQLCDIISKTMLESITSENNKLAYIYSDKVKIDPTSSNGNIDGVHLYYPNLVVDIISAKILSNLVIQNIGKYNIFELTSVEIGSIIDINLYTTGKGLKMLYQILDNTSYETNNKESTFDLKEYKTSIEKLRITSIKTNADKINFQFIIDINAIKNTYNTTSEEKKIDNTLVRKVVKSVEDNKKVTDNLTLDYLRSKHDLSDEGLVDLYYNVFKDMIKYVDSNIFYKYNPTSKLWEENNNNDIICHFIREIKLIIKPLVSHYLKLAENLDFTEAKRKDFSELAKQINTDKRITVVSQAKGLLCMFQNVFKDHTFRAKLDNNKDLLSVKNGVVNLKTGELRNRIAEDYFTSELNVEWKGLDYKTEKIDTFMKDIMLDEQDMIKYLQTILGYSITGYVTEKRFVIFWGVDGNGKSTLMLMLKELMGTFYRQAMSNLILQENKSNNGSANPHIMQLLGARLVFIDDSVVDEKLNETVITNITNGASITARGLFKDFVTFDPTFQIFLLTNHKPEIKVSQSIEQRLILIPFLAEFRDKNKIDPNNKKHKLKDVNIESVMKNSLDEFLVWLVRGSINYFKNGLGEIPEVANKAVNGYLEENDDITNLINAYCLIKKSGEISHKMLHNLYTQNYKTISQKMFTNLMKNKGYLTKRSGGRSTFIGLELKTKL